ncbi:hypothetical protein FOMPIDRAFT_1046879 [Fomitopsis schrenkii]|uniref:Fungal-type protein kinase domain-containing protein n=1 Tax=Fomitopsis schrenkii TaxID=2126942 RepID=S8EJ46_FOMSC|nr:hypothetical protein FOMPIDRAFT_1046879 [Fomitopsis schrenkii]
MRQSHHIPDGTAAQREELVNLAFWSRDIWQKIKQVPSTTSIDEYLNHFVPSDEGVPLPPCPPGNIGEGDDEKLMYPYLVRALTRLVKKFPEEIRPNFHNYNHAEMKFPFEIHGREEPATAVDVVATIPALRVVAPLYRWRNVALVFELKSRREDDPMLAETPTNWATLAQLAESARNIMLAQGRLYCFIVGIYGGKARIFRFDYAGAICSPAFEYRERPEILHKFLWRLFHPAVEGCTIVGQDPTVSLGTAEDRELAEELAKDFDPEWKHTPETRKAVRKFVMTEDDGKETTYLAYKLISVNSQLFSGSAVVWEAFKLDAKGKRTRKERYIIKDTWRQLGRLDEAGFYEMLRDEKTQETVYGAAKYVSGRDYGGETSAEREEAAKLEEAGKGRRMVSHTGEEVPALSAKEEERLPVVQDILAGHRTVSAAHNRHTALPREKMLEQVHLYERSYVRTVLRSVGTPLSEFPETKELATAFRDAIEGHRLAYEKGVIHRDVIEGNVMICRDPDSPLKGFMHDFDHSFSWLRFLGKQGWDTELATWVQYCAEHGHEPAGPNNEDGTPLFMSVNVLEGDMKHEARHDLESFFWLLLFIVLQHTSHNPSGREHDLIRVIFGGPGATLEQRKLNKFYFLALDKPARIKGNPGMTYILDVFHSLCRGNVTLGAKLEACPGMTHDEVLDIFNRVLTMKWPMDNDGPRRWEVPSNALHTVETREVVNKVKLRGDLSDTTYGDKAKANGQNAQPAPQIPGTADHSEIGDASLAIMDFSDDEIPSDAEERRPIAPDAPPGLALLDVDPVPEATTHDPPAHPADAQEETSDSGVTSGGQPRRRALDPPQESTLRDVDPTLDAISAPDQHPPMDHGEDAQEGTTDPSRPTHRAKSPSRMKRAPAMRRARATRQVAVTRPARNLDGVDTQTGRRYNLRSSSRLNSNSATSECVQPRMTRSQTKAASLQREAGTKDSSMRKRRRAARDEVEDDEGRLGEQSSKRQRTLSQPRGPKAIRLGN